MRILKHIKVPTGDIIVADTGQGKLEFLSIGDYGKDVNLKADFLGLTTDPNPVRHTALLPLEEKWVITISTQYGCDMGCSFCDVPRVGRGVNISESDLIGQILHGLSLHPEVKRSNRLNVHFARMGEPTFNPAVLKCAEWLKFNCPHKAHPVVSTMMPKDNPWLKLFLRGWMDVKNNLYKGNAGLQISINSTDERERAEMFRGNALPLREIAGMMGWTKVEGRKITLNFAVADYTIDPKVLLRWFDPARFLVKLTPMHKTNTAIQHGIETTGDYTSYAPYEHIEEGLKDVGFDVLVFIASKEEDLGRITCGNAILAGTMPDCPHEIII